MSEYKLKHSGQQIGDAIQKVRDANGSLLATGNITTAISSENTDEQVPSAKAVHSALEELGTGPGGDCVALSNSNPFMNGTASPGADGTASRYDHVHPTDTSRAKATAKKTALDSPVQDNTEYRLGILASAAQTITLPAAGTAFECWIKFTMPSSGTPSVTFSGGAATWIGKKPTWALSKTYEMSIQDHVIVAAEVGDGA